MDNLIKEIKEDKSQHGRFKDLPWYPKEETHLIVGGVGGIGSWTVLLLAKAGFKVFAYDFDFVEEHNIGGQLYRKKDVGKAKVHALKEIVKEFTNEDIYCFTERMGVDSMTNDYVISCFDNISARRMMYNSWKKVWSGDRRAIFLDASLAAEQFGVYAIKANDPVAQKKYETEYLSIKDEDIEDAPCTARQTSHFAAAVAARLVTLFTNHITNVNEGANIRQLPFESSYFGPLDLTEVNSVL